MFAPTVICCANQIQHMWVRKASAAAQLARMTADFQPDKQPPVAPSAIRIQNGQAFTYEGPKDFSTPRELTKEEIKGLVSDFATTAKNAIEAGVLWTPALWQPRVPSQSHSVCSKLRRHEIASKSRVVALEVNYRMVPYGLNPAMRASHCSLDRHSGLQTMQTAN